LEVSLAEAQDQHRAVKEAAAEEYASLEASKAAWEREAGQLKETMSAVLTLTLTLTLTLIGGWTA